MKSARQEVVVFDLDGVLCDFVLGFTGVGNKLFGTPVISTYQHQEWDAFPEMTDLMVDECWNYINVNPDFWRSLIPLLGQTTLHDIDELPLRGHLVYFATSRKNGHYESVQWLKGYGIRNPQVVMTAKKGEFCRAVKATYMIDDKAGNAMYAGYHCNTVKAYLVDRAYNQFPHGVAGSRVRRVKSVEEFIHDIREGA